MNGLDKMEFIYPENQEIKIFIKHKNTKFKVVQENTINITFVKWTLA